MQQNFWIEQFVEHNELETLHQDVRKFGKTLRGIVKFFVAFFLFELLNLCIDFFTKHTQLITADTFRLLEEGLKAFVNQNLVAFFSIFSEHNLFAAVLMTFACVFGAEFVADALFTFVNFDSEKSREKENHKVFKKQECASVTCVVAYKQKVCFLS